MSPCIRNVGSLLLGGIRAMNLLYKPDWEETKERLKAWWAHEVIDRCAIQVYAPKEGLPSEEPPSVPSVPHRWLDYDYLRARNDYQMRHTFYGGEALPIWNPGYPGWNCIPVYLGASVTLKESTGWISPTIQRGTLTDYDYRNLVIDPDNRWWKRALEMQNFSVAEAKGKSIPTTGAIGGCGDTLAALRGTQELLVDLLDCPDYVREFDLYLMKQWCEVYDTLHEITRGAAEGSAGWFDLWSPGKFYAAQNDFAYMISPQVFSDVFLPSIEMQTNFLDHTIHHVDGIGNFAHVDALCELPRLQALQILPGSGKPSPLCYMDVLKKVQAAGKNLHISIRPEEVEAALQELSVEGLFIQTHCATEAEARDLLKSVHRWSRRHPCL